MITDELKGYMASYGFNTYVCDIYNEWQEVKDELLVSARTNGNGSGNYQFYANQIKNEFQDYINSIRHEPEANKETAIRNGEITISNFYIKLNIINELVGFAAKSEFDGTNSGITLSSIFTDFQTFPGNIVKDTSKITLRKTDLAVYFRDFDSNGFFKKVVVNLLFPCTKYMAYLFKNNNNEYAAIWLFRNFGTSYYLPQTNTTTTNDPLQQIFYGAPGTGKSDTIKEATKNEFFIRTTFHPDSDYASFVGAYKPVSTEDDLRDASGNKISDFNGNKVYDANGNLRTEKRVVYDFIEQAFLQAYIEAWKSIANPTQVQPAPTGNAAQIAVSTPLSEEEGAHTDPQSAPAGANIQPVVSNPQPKKVFLIIEEINRGNCAQIFGDLFQLLDRNDNGYSVYPIKADSDLQRHLKAAFANISIANRQDINEANYDGKLVVEDVLNGNLLALPNNLYIWATMNTSDQSLFHIDSAFKRRWDWEYIPISEGRDKNSLDSLNWKIYVGSDQYDWWKFLQAINEKIDSITSSEDKKLGYFFCKAKNGIISQEVFVSKVIFYLWNDVFKDFGFEDNIFNDSDNNSKLSFSKFYTVGDDGKKSVDPTKIRTFLSNLSVSADNTANSQGVNQPVQQQGANPAVDGQQGNTQTGDYSLDQSQNGNGAPANQQNVDPNNSGENAGDGSINDNQ